MTVVVLAAGTSSRFGKKDKLLIPCKAGTLVSNTCLEALKYLSKKQGKQTLVVVTGYRSTSVVKALKPCIEFVNNSECLEMIIAKNSNYRDGQFSSTKVGIENVPDNEDFFIQLADMPIIQAEHYALLDNNILGNNDAVRPFCNNIPGHPVLLSKNMKKVILAEKNSSVSKILASHTVRKYRTTDKAYITDIDTQSDLLQNI